MINDKIIDMHQSVLEKLKAKERRSKVKTDPHIDTNISETRNRGRRRQEDMNTWGGKAKIAGRKRVGNKRRKEMTNKEHCSR